MSKKCNEEPHGDWCAANHVIETDNCVCGHPRRFHIMCRPWGGQSLVCDEVDCLSARNCTGYVLATNCAHKAEIAALVAELRECATKLEAIGKPVDG